MADPARLNGLGASLALVRHGQTTWIAEGRFQGSADPPLSEAGRRQAAAVATRLAAPEASPALPLPATTPLGIWHSPLSRAAATAAAVAAARHHDSPLRAEPALMELAQGDWEGLLQQEVQTRYPEELAAWRRDPTLHHAPGGESIHDAAVRARAAVDGILAALGEAEPTAAAQPCEAAAAQPGTASSGTTDSHVLGYETRPEATAQPWAIVVAHDGILRLVLARLLDLPLVNYWAFPFGLCNVTVVEIRNGSGRLRAHNLAEHLGPDRA